MNQQEQNKELIERFFDGDLNIEEVIAFKQRIELDAELRNLFEERKSIQKIWRQASEYEKVQREVSASIANIKTGDGEGHRSIRMGNNGTVRKNEHPDSISVAEPRKGRSLLPNFTRPVFYAIAAGLLLILGTIAVFMVLNRTNEAPMAKQETNDSLLKMEHGQPPAYKGKEEIKSVDRSAAVELITPADGATFSVTDKVTFKWKNPFDSVTHLYLVPALKGKKITQIRIEPGLEEYKLNVKTLQPGTYEWFLGSRKAVRTFIIKP